ncbi:hypothetical protein AHMF7605_20875 [Adhaeribacter arboris]|uniref:Uncharacterized protein n=1 Tax=Adhaeribacter arboris TaxID=2072846 RepID=A0A2T2YJV0_9BACT|nr:hypothetical protein [Adhaeribacter arboris]PSR55778.1 hypothetical protein AHMF7605_20875 [Adhaeribacter arboris]
MEINNRELAGLIWIGIFIAWVMMRPETRKNVPGLFKAAFQSKLSIIYGIMAAYTAIVVFLLYRIELWNSSQIKNTILWFLTVGLVSLNDITKHNQVNFFKKTASDVLSLTAILQFITGVYTFSFITEFTLIPFAVLIGCMIAMAERKPEHVSVRKLLKGMLALAGLYTISFTIYKIATDFQTFANRGTLNDFLIPGALSFLFLPLMYLLSLYAARENTFIGLGNVLSPSLLRLAKWYTLRYFVFNKDDLQRWQRYIFVKKIESKTDLRCSIKFIKQLKKIEKNPPSVPIEMGWSLYIAKEALTTEGIKTGQYLPNFNEEWSASSTYLKIDDDLLANNIAYYIEGNSRVAVRLKLVLNVNDPAKANNAHTKMVGCAKLLYRFAMNQDIPKTILDALSTGKRKELQIGDKCILVYKNNWSEHKMQGYSLKFTIGVGNTSVVEF